MTMIGASHFDDAARTAHCEPIRAAVHRSSPACHSPRRSFPTIRDRR